MTGGEKHWENTNRKKRKEVQKENNRPMSIVNGEKQGKTYVNLVLKMRMEKNANDQKDHLITSFVI